MKRRRLFETLTATLLVALMMVDGFAAPAMAQGNSGKNKDKDGSDDDSAFVDPGVGYAVELVDLPEGAVSAILFDCNNAGQVVGEAFIDGVSRALLIESAGTSGSSYVLDEITEGVPHQQSSGNLDISYPQHSFSLNDSLDVVGLDFLIHGDAGKFSIFDLLDLADAGTGVLLQNAERLTLEIVSNRIMEDSDFPVVYGRVVLEDGMESVVILTPFPSE